MLRLSSIKSVIKSHIVNSVSVLANSASALANYKFESADVSGNTIFDYATSTYNATITGTIDNTIYRSGRGSLKDGTLVGLQTVSTANMFSISMWVNPTSGEVLYSMYEASLNNIKCRFDGTDIYVYYNSGNGSVMNVTIPFNSNTWTHLVFVYNVTDFSFYMNGTLRVTKLGFITIPSTANRTVYFTKSPEGWVTYKGHIDDCRLYNYALSATNVSDLYNS